MTCGGGTRTNVRSEKVSPAHGGDKCDGIFNITESCNEDECPGMELAFADSFCIYIR